MRSVPKAVLAALLVAGTLPASAQTPPPTREGFVVVEPADFTVGVVRTYRVVTHATLADNAPIISTQTLRIEVVSGGEQPRLRITVASYEHGPAYAPGPEEIAAEAMAGIPAEYDVDGAGRPTAMREWETVRVRFTGNLRALPASPARDGYIAASDQATARHAAASLARDAFTIADLQSRPPFPSAGVSDPPWQMDTESGPVRMGSHQEFVGFDATLCAARLRRWTGTEPATQHALNMYLSTEASVSVRDGWVVRMRADNFQDLAGTVTQRRRDILRTDTPPCSIALPRATAAAG